MHFNRNKVQFSGHYLVDHPTCLFIFRRLHTTIAKRRQNLLNLVNRKTQNIPDQNESKVKTFKTYKFQDSWKDSFPWLEYSQDQGTATGTMTVLTIEKLSEINNIFNNCLCVCLVCHMHMIIEIRNMFQVMINGNDEHQTCHTCNKPC